AVSQIMSNARDKASMKSLDFSGTNQNSGEKFTIFDYAKHIRMIVPVSLMGLVIGILPGLGGNISNLMAYSYAKNTSKHPEEFGKGCVEGIIASETANNATVGGAMIILLTLGIPGDNATSVILAGFQMNDIAPGPLLFKTQGKLVYAILAAFVLANVLFFLMEYFGLPIFTKMLSIPSMLLLPIVIVCCFLGSYCANNNILDILIMVLFGVLGYVLKKFKYPLAPMVVGFILSPMLELYLRRSLMKTQGAWLPILSSPVAAVCCIMTVVTILLTIRSKLKKDAVKAE
ncbi:MAG: tripartite tricarboxylate transporter permease, partial [Clostridium sp.]|nr:tripartite tricarboxylate transporter permease [Clostridium sp.]